MYPKDVGRLKLPRHYALLGSSSCTFILAFERLFSGCLEKLCLSFNPTTLDFIKPLAWENTGFRKTSAESLGTPVNFATVASRRPGWRVLHDHPDWPSQSSTGPRRPLHALEDCWGKHALVGNNRVVAAAKLNPKPQTLNPKPCTHRSPLSRSGWCRLACPRASGVQGLGFRA